MHDTHLLDVFLSCPVHSFPQRRVQYDCLVHHLPLCCLESLLRLSGELCSPRSIVLKLHHLVGIIPSSSLSVVQLTLNAGELVFKAFDTVSISAVRLLQVGDVDLGLVKLCLNCGRVRSGLQILLSTIQLILEARSSIPLLFQLFLEPFGRPSVVIVDARE